MERRATKPNWGRGRLCAHESIISFVAKFSVLNGLPVRKTRDHFRNILPYICFESFPQVPESELRRLACTIDEPLAVVRTVFRADWNLPESLGQIKLDRLENNKDRLYYCADCLASGFHASFHRAQWFKICLIHEKPLLFQYIDSRGGAAHFDQTVSTLIRLFEQHDINWRRFKLADFSLIQMPTAKRNISKLSRWLCSLHKAIFDLQKSCVGCTSQPVFNFEHSLDFLLSKANWIQPLPKYLAELLQLDLTNPSPVVKVLDHIGSGDQLNQLFQTVSLSELLWFFKKTAALAEIKPSFWQIADAALDGFVHSKGTDKCNCKWGWAKHDAWSGNWRVVAPGEWPKWDLKCAVEHEVEEYKGRWFGGFTPNNSWDRSHLASWDRYVRLAIKYQKYGIVQAIGPYEGQITLGSPPPESISLKFESNAYNILNQIALFEIGKDISNVTRRMLKLENGDVPWRISEEAGSTCLYFENTFTIISW